MPLKRKFNLLSLGWTWNFSVSFSLAAIKENVWAGTAGLFGTARPGLLGTGKCHIKVRGGSARVVFSSKNLFLLISPLWSVIFYTTSIPRERKFNSESNGYSNFSWISDKHCDIMNLVNCPKKPRVFFVFRKKSDFIWKIVVHFVFGKKKF